MVGMQVREKDAVDRADRHSSLSQTKSGAATAIEEQAHAAGFDQCAGSELLQADPGPTPVPSRTIFRFAVDTGVDSSGPLSEAQRAGWCWC
jgi:hypothetical protein